MKKKLIFYIGLSIIICFVYALIYTNQYKLKYEHKNNWFVKNDKVYYYEELTGCSFGSGCSSTIKKHLLENADGSTFQKLNNLYAKDKSNAYFKYIKINDVDAPSFEVVKDGYAKDKNKVLTIIESLQNISGEPISYNNIHIIAGADPNSIEALSFHYSKDKNNVYYRNIRIAKADPNSFITYEIKIKTGTDNIRFDAEDKENIYFYGRKVGENNTILQ